MGRQRLLSKTINEHLIKDILYGLVHFHTAYKVSVNGHPMYEKYGPFLCSKYPVKIGQDLLDIQILNMLTLV